MSTFSQLVDEISKQTGPRYRGDSLYGFYRLCLSVHEGRTDAAKLELLKFLQGEYPSRIIEYSKKVVRSD
jgi:hypothetical protein